MVREEFPTRSEGWLQKRHAETFGDRLREETRRNPVENPQLRWLAAGPSQTIMTYQGYEINGFTFYTASQDAKSTNQNSGACVQAYDSDGTTQLYYGTIEKIWELDYGPLKVPLFKCKWVNNKAGGVAIDQYGMTTVDLQQTGFLEEPFSLANDVMQVFYVMDMSSKPKKKKDDRKNKKNKNRDKDDGQDKSSEQPKRHVVLKGKRRIVGVEDVVDEQEYNQFDELPSFGQDVHVNLITDNIDAPYVRHDHEEGMVVQTKYVNLVSN